MAAEDVKELLQVGVVMHKLSYMHLFSRSTLVSNHGHIVRKSSAKTELSSGMSKEGTDGHFSLPW